MDGIDLQSSSENQFFLKYDLENMCDTISKGDILTINRIGKFTVPGVYLLSWMGKMQIFRCRIFRNEYIKLSDDEKPTPTITLHETFEKCVIGYVGNVQKPSCH